MSVEATDFTINDFYNPYHGVDRLGNHVVPPDPRTLYLVGPNGRLATIVGVTHTYDPDSPTIGQLCEAWKVHVANTDPESRESLCEGNPTLLPDWDPTSLIEFGSERALQLHLAQNEGAPVKPLDTDNRTEFEAVLAIEGVDPAALLEYATLRHGTHRPFGVGHRGLVQTLNEQLERYKTYLPEAQQQEFAGISIEDLHRRIFGRPLAHDLADPLFVFDQTVSFWLSDSEVQKIAILWNDYRDTQQIIKRILESMDSGKDPFIVIGWEHVERLKPKLQKLGRFVLASALEPGSHLPIPGLVSVYNYNALDHPYYKI